MLMLLPCNLDKQHLYPNFVGYLIVPNSGSIRDDSNHSVRYPIQLIDGRYSMERCPQFLEIERALKLLFRIAEDVGHKFPSKASAVTTSA